MTSSTSTLSILVPRVSVGRTQTSNPSTRVQTARRTRVSSETLSRLSARALPVTMLVAPSPTSREVLVLPSTWLPVVSSLCFGIARTLRSGDSNGPRYLKTSRMMTLTLTLGELPLLCGPKTRAISLPLSVTSTVRSSCPLET
jgi:hypothetical protein